MNTHQPIQDEPGKLIKGHAGMRPKLSINLFNQLIDERRKSEAYRQIIIQRDAEILRLKGELEAARETSMRLNRRAQVAEAALPDVAKLAELNKAGASRSIGDGLRRHYYFKISEENERLKGELAEAQKGWVSVKDRLPKAHGYYETRTIQFFSLATGGFSRPAHEEETHWRELPEPPIANP